jgi:hypothetical protein
LNCAFVQRQVLLLQRLMHLRARRDCNRYHVRWQQPTPRRACVRLLVHSYPRVYTTIFTCGFCVFTCMLCVRDTPPSQSWRHDTAAVAAERTG